MDLTHRFSVAATVEQTWNAFTRWERVAPCLPGASVSRADQDGFDGSLKVKLGPLALAFDGSGHYVERDATAHRVVVRFDAQDRRGLGTADATVTVVVAPGEDEASATVEVSTDLTVAGRPAQLGRGVVADVAERLAEQFGRCVSGKLADGLGRLPTPDDGDATASPDGAHATVDHPVELGDTPGDVDETEPAPPPARPQPVPPKPYEYRPFGNVSEPDVTAVTAITKLLVRRVGPYLGAAALLAYAAVAASRRKR